MTAGPPDAGRCPRIPEDSDVLSAKTTETVPPNAPTRSDARLNVVHSEDGCDECSGRLGVPKPGRSKCPVCHNAYLDGLRRRGAAELRMLPSAWDLGVAS